MAMDRRRHARDTSAGYKGRMNTHRSISAFVLVLFVASVLHGQSGPSPLGLSPGRITLHAHNCFPEEGKWTDRIDRALATGVRPIAIEQDVVWSAERKQSVLTHGAALTGHEPTLEDHFFKRIQPLVERALAEGRRDTWPLFVPHFNFRNNDAEHLRAVWDLLGRYESWLTTAEKGADETPIKPLRPGPVMVLTQEGQQQIFYDAVPVGARLRVFGTVATGRPSVPAGATREMQAAAVADASPDTLIPQRATNYRRWINFSWAAVERGGQPKAGEWTDADAARLRALVNRAHGQGLWIRFFTLNGHTPAESQGWSSGYNFGSLDAARLRWRAAIDAGVDYIGVDQYELFAEELKGGTRTP